MSVCRFSVELDRVTDFVYYGGEILRGHVVLELQREISIRGIELRLYGGSHVQWVEKRKKDEDTTTEIEHTADDIHFDNAIILWGKTPSSGEMEVLSIGRHLFPFHFILPPDLPCSFEGHHGWVRYYARTTLRMRRARDDMSSIRYFTVFRDLDLKKETAYLDGAKEQRETIMRSTCCKAGKVTCSLNIPRSGYVPGECIETNVQIQNLSTRKIKELTLCLRQTVKYSTSSPHQSKKISWDLKKVPLGSIRPGRTEQMPRVRLEVPAITASRVDGCRFIDIKYELALNIELHPVVVTMTVPITLGTLPSRQSLVASWDYQEQVICCDNSPRCRSAVNVSTPGPRKEKQECPFIPMCKVYRFLGAPSHLRTLEESPSFSRYRKQILLYKAGNMESNV